MKIKIIFFIVGSGGNFLNRVLTLDPKTVPLGGYCDDSNNYLSPQDRAYRYHYDRVTEIIGNKFNIIGTDNLTDWVKVELEKMYFPFTIGFEKLVELNQLVIEMVHPHQWQEKKELLGKDDEIELFYLDLKGCESWVASQRLHKVSTDGKWNKTLKQVYQDQENMLKLVNELNIQPFFLKEIISDTNSFMQECQRICTLFELKFYPDLALSIYESWKLTWGNYEGDLK